MKIKGAIFDLDGTLLDSMGIWDDVGAEYLKMKGIEPHGNLREAVRRMSIQEAVRYMQKEYGIEDSEEQMIADAVKIVERFYTDEVQLKEGAEEFVRYLYKSGVKLCVATATEKILAEAALKRCGLDLYFEHIFTCTEVGSSKKEPHIFNTACDFLGTEKDKTWVFEDTVHAAKTAKNAGFCVCGVYDKYESKTKELEQLADVYITTFKETDFLL